jgi:hypothetical protein
MSRALTPNILTAQDLEPQLEMGEPAARLGPHIC